MSLVFKTIQTEGIAELSYLLGDDDEGVAAVFDPRPDCDIYVEMARELGVAITHIFETHIHADLVSGSRELSARVDSAKIYVSHEGGAAYGFEHEKIEDGDRFTFGETVVTARHTPGHTPEHISYLLADVDLADEPWGILTGDSLFVSSAGRPDLLGEKYTKQLAEQQFRTLRDFYLELPDHVRNRRLLKSDLVPRLELAGLRREATAALEDIAESGPFPDLQVVVKLQLRVIRQPREQALG